MGRDRRRDPSIAWDEIESIEVRTIDFDVVVLVHPHDVSAWYATQRRGVRALMALYQGMFGGSRFAISTRPLTLPLDEILARIALHKPSLIDR